jgi:hypothetical protein
VKSWSNFLDSNETHTNVFISHVNDNAVGEHQNQSSVFATLSLYKEMAHNLTDQQEATIKVIVVILEHQPEDCQRKVTFTDWAYNAVNKDGTPLFGDQRGKDSLFQYCRQCRFRNVKESYRSFLNGQRSHWKPLTRAEYNPLEWLQDIPPIRALTEEEFAIQSTRPATPTPTKSNNMRGSSRGRTPPRGTKKQVKIDEAGL